MKNEISANTTVAALLVVFVLFSIGCGKREETVIVTQNCTVVRSGIDALIECPDGSSVILPATTITETVYETPIIIEIPKKTCKKDK